MTRRFVLLLLLLATLTVGGFVVALVVTVFLACGLSGCGGFGPSFSPKQTQAGLLVCGLTLLPLVLLALRNRRLAWRVTASATVVVIGAVTAMSLLDLGANGCPQGQSRAVVSHDGFSPGTATCSGDRNALRANRAKPLRRRFG
ncbi:MAG: hypothetical protein H7270_00645 [Dermatophilaceae bacterium]|nr:hypothetical protein [Dermatophilaceae bacterium]